MRRTPGFLLFFLLFCIAPSTYADSRADIEKIVRDYTGLYTQASLDQWKQLFHPSLTVAHPADDGGIRVRNLEEFFTAQKEYFPKRKSISERLENVQIFEGQRMARVIANFIFVDEGVESPGVLGLHLVEGKEGWRIVAIIFAYK